MDRGGLMRAYAIEKTLSKTVMFCLKAGDACLVREMQIGPGNGLSLIWWQALNWIIYKLMSISDMKTFQRILIKKYPTVIL